MRSTLRHAGLFLAIVLALVAQQIVVNPPYAVAGWALFAVAALIAAASAPALERSTTPPPSAARTRRSGISAARVVAGAAALAAAVASAWLSNANQRPGPALLLWLASFVLASLALIGTIVSPPRRASAPWSRREALILAAICIVALVARTVWLDDVPRYYFDDESRVGMYIRNLFAPDTFPNLFAMGWNSWPIVGMALQGIFAPVLGVDTTSLRLSSALAGTFAVLFAYLLTRELFSPRVALLSAVLFACGRTALDFSRMGICHAQVLVFETLAFWSLWRAVNSGSGLSYLWTGIGLGLCMYTYNAGQLVPLLWLGWVGVALVCAPRQALQSWRGGLITATALVLTVLPFLLYVTDYLGFAGRWQEYTGMARNRQVLTRVTDAWTSLGPAEGLRILGEQARLTWLGFNVLPADAYALGYRGGGMLDHVSAPLFVLGLAIGLARFWTPRYAFVLYWWLLTMIAGGVMTQAPPAYVRLVGILPALALFGALPLDGLLRAAGTSVLRTVALVAVALLGGAMALDNYRTYFVAFPRDSSQPSSEAVRYIATTPPDTVSLLIGAEHYLELSTEIYRLDLPNQRFENVGEPSQVLPLREMADKPVALLFGNTQLTLVPYAQSLYPGVPVTEIPERGRPEILFRAMLIPAQQIGARQGLAATRDDSTTGEHAIADPFSATSPFSACRQLRWTGGIYWPSDQAVTVHVEAPPTTSVTLGKTSLTHTKENDQASATVIQLPRGWNRISVHERCTSNRGLSLAMEHQGHTTTFTRRDLRPDYEDEGLLATFLRNETPVLRMIDGHVNALAVEELLHVPYDVPVHMPFTATWSGSLEIDIPGEYAFDAVFSGPMLLTLDGDPVLQETVKIPEEPRTARVTRTLSKGSHPLFALWDSTRRAHTSRRIFQLYWQPPNGVRELIPPTHFRPATASNGAHALPTISIPPTPTPIALSSGPRQVLTELTAQDVQFGFVAPRINKSWSGAPISMRGIEYERGIGVHAWTRMTYAVPAAAVELQAIIGLADDAKDCPRASVRFEVHDERDAVLYDSGIIDGFAPPKLAKAPLAGVTAVTLVVTDGGDGIDCDHANWAEPSFLLR